MNLRTDNPFRITKSNNLTDEQIEQLWVSVTDDNGIAGLMRPTSRMPMFILGGKGSGKSHLMRYYSFPVQAIRFRTSGARLADGLASDEYIGIYARCSGMDSNRFQGKGVNEEIWAVLFAYYFELWVADKTLAAIIALVEEGSIPPEADERIGVAISETFDSPIDTFRCVRDARQFLSKIRKEVDYAVNNAAFVNRVDIEVLVTQGRLFFELPKIVCSNIPILKDVVFAYLFDELEHFPTPRQMYINTLIREHEGPVAFKIGARLYGRRTLATLSGGERNLQGSEYEDLPLDERFRNNPDTYKRFILKLISRRLDPRADQKTMDVDSQSHLYGFFEKQNIDWNSFLPFLPKSTAGERPHLVNLQEKLDRGVKDDFVVGANTAADVRAIVAAVSFPDYPVLEKLCILHVFQKWFRSANIADAAEYVRERAMAKLEGAKHKQFDEFVSKHKADMIAQCLRENGQKQVYAGLESFIRMSEGLPRTLITILKHVYDWATYMGEEPFVGKISISSQQRGVAEAADLFLEQMLPDGEDGVSVGSAIERLCELFRVNRFADKPIETSLIAFSVDQFSMSPEVRSVLDLATKTSLLIPVQGGQRERNSMGVTNKLQINTMLAPRRDLPIARRGVIPLDSEEMESIFVEGRREEFVAMTRWWVARMTAPSFGRSSSGAKAKKRSARDQADLFE